MSTWSGCALLCALFGATGCDDALHPFIVRACKCDARECAERVVDELREVARSQPRARGNLAELEGRIEQLDKCLSRFGITSGISGQVPAHR